MAAPVAIICLTYLMLAKRQFDFYSIAILSTILYFLPIFYGQVWYHVYGHDVYNTITPEMDFIYTLVLLTLLIATLINDFSRPMGRSTAPRKGNLSLSRYIYLMSLMAWIILIFTNFSDMISGQKENLGSLYSIASTAVPFALIIAAIEGNKKWLFIFISLAAFDMYSGNREMLAFSAIAGTLLFLSSKGKIRLLRYAKHGSILILAVFLLLVYKQVGAAMILGRWDLIAERLTDFEFYLMSISRSEPFVVQSTLHQALEGNWSYSGTYLLNIIFIMIPFMGYVMEQPYTVSAHINNSAGDVGYGLASNIWAEAYVLGGHPAIILFCIGYAILPAIMNFIVSKCRHEHARVIATLIAVVLIFYIHRSGLEMAIVIAKRFLLFYVGLIITHKLLLQVTKT